MKTEKHPLVPTVPSGLDPKLSRWMTDITNSFLKLSQTTRSDLDSVIGAGVGVGFFYTQYPDADSNDEAVAFPVAKAPAAIFGGTWEEQWDDEATYFRTRGDPNVAEDQDVGRTDGLQEDQGQGWQLGATADSIGDRNYWSNAGTRDYAWTDNVVSLAGYAPLLTKSGGANQGAADRMKAMDDGTNGAPRTGYTNQNRNRLCIIWKRTS
jgi:hypothetical protein